MVKLSQQFIDRPTRTERVLEKQKGDVNGDVISQPQAITEAQAIQENIGKVEDQINYARQRILDAEEDHEKDLEDIRKKRNQRPKDADYYDEKEDKIDDKLEEKQQYWLGYISGLKQGLGKLKSGQYLDYKNITGYATDIGQYERDLSKAQNRERESNKSKAEEVRKLEEGGYQPQLIHKVFVHNFYI